MMLSVNNLYVGYGSVPVLRNISFSQEHGEILGIVGHNGMGKTTLLRALMGILPTTSGSIMMGGAAIQSRPAHDRSRLGIGYVPQGGRCFPDLTVLDNLKLAVSMKTHGPHRTVDEVVALFPRLTPFLTRRCFALSGGERQLLAIAQAVIRSPKLLLLDELTEGVQPSIVEEIAECLVKIHDETMSIIIVDQERAFVASLAKRMLVLEKGRLMEIAAGELSESDLLGGVG